MRRPQRQTPENAGGGRLTRRTVLCGAAALGTTLAAAGMPAARAATTLRWWSTQSSPEQLAAYRYQIDAFEAAHPGVSIRFERTSDEGYAAQLAAAFAGGRAPNLVTHLPSFAVADYWNAGLLLPFDDVIAAVGADNFLDGANRVYESGGLTFTTNNQTVVSGTLVAEDFARPGFNAILTAAANLDDSVEDAGLNVVYLGFTSDGHVGRLFVLPTAYLAFGTDDFNPVAGQETSVSAFMAGIELAYPKNWLTYRAAAFVASGDSDPDDDSATGFDSILDNVGLFGGATSFVVGGASFFTRPNSFLPAGRVAASGLGTRANFVNPGIQLLNAGLDAVVSPRIFAQLDYNYFRFFEPAAAGLADDEAALGQEINAALRFRAFLNENLVFQVGGSAFLPGTAGEALLGASDTILTGNVALLALF